MNLPFDFMLFNNSKLFLSFSWKRQQISALDVRKYVIKINIKISQRSCYLGLRSLGFQEITELIVLNNVVNSFPICPAYLPMEDTDSCLPDCNCCCSCGPTKSQRFHVVAPCHKRHQLNSESIQMKSFHLSLHKNFHNRFLVPPLLFI